MGFGDSELWDIPEVAVSQSHWLALSASRQRAEWNRFSNTQSFWHQASRVMMASKSNAAAGQWTSMNGLILVLFWLMQKLNSRRSRLVFYTRYMMIYVYVPYSSRSRLHYFGISNAAAYILLRIHDKAGQCYQKILECLSLSTFCTGLLCSNILQPKPCLALSGSIEVQACRVSRVVGFSAFSCFGETCHGKGTCNTFGYR